MICQKSKVSIGFHYFYIYCATSSRGMKPTLSQDGTMKPVSPHCSWYLSLNTHILMYIGIKKPSSRTTTNNLVQLQSVSFAPRLVFPLLEDRPNVVNFVSLFPCLVVVTRLGPKRDEPTQGSGAGEEEKK